MFVVDTNILVYAANANAPENAVCRDWLDSWRSRTGAWYLTWNICYEFLRVTTHPRVFQHPLSAREAWRFLHSVLASDGAGVLLPTERHGAILEDMIHGMPNLAGNLVHDATTVTLMNEHGIRRIYTRDADFYRFADIEPIDPLATAP